jgi:hypothetical protein
LDSTPATAENWRLKECTPMINNTDINVHQNMLMATVSYSCKSFYWLQQGRNTKGTEVYRSSKVCFQSVMHGFTVSNFEVSTSHYT